MVVLALMRALAGPGIITFPWRTAWLVVFVVISTLLAAAVTRIYSDPLNRRLCRIFRDRNGTTPVAMG